MNIWTKRLLILISVGGGYCGAVFMSFTLPQVQGRPAGYLLIAAMIAVFGFGVWAGLKFIEDEARGLRLLQRFFAIQIPILSSPYAAYQLSSGFSVNLAWIGARLSAFFRFGSEMTVAFLQNRPWGLGVNVFALVMFLWTCRMIRRNAKRSDPMPAAPTAVPLPAEEEPRQP